jgi:predicted DNA-binding transcriptional regulator AlpA
MFEKLVPLNQSFERLGIRRTTGYAQIRDGLLPHPVRTGKRNKGLPNEEIVAIISARAKGASDEQLRDLVKQLATARGYHL